MTNVEAAADKLAKRLRQLANRLEAEWPSVPSTPNQAARHVRARFVNRFAAEAGKALIEAAQAGVFDGEGEALIESASAPYIDKGLRNWEYHVFLHIVQHWLQHRAPGYGGPSMAYPDIALEPPGKQLLGIKYARNMRAIADAVRPAGAARANSLDETTALGNIANDALTLRSGLRKSAMRCHKAAADGSPKPEIWETEVREYIQIAQGLAVAVAVYLPEMANRLKILDRDCIHITSERFRDWTTLESELQAIETAALGALNCGQVADVTPDQSTGGAKNAVANRSDSDRRPAATVNMRMFDALLKNPDCRNWSAQQWATHLGCAKSTVAETDAWKSLKIVKGGVALERIAKSAQRQSRRRNRGS
jgi:hypothetical protein